METRSRQNGDKVYLREEIARDVDGIAQTTWPALRYPVKLLYHIFSASFRLFKPFAPQIVPLAVFILAFPIIVFLSLSSGWFVWRSIAVGWETELQLQYGDGIPPYAQVYLQNVVAQQPYDISLHLVVPASETNFALGNFMSTLSLATHANRTLAVVRKPAIVMRPCTNPWTFFFRSPGTVEIKVSLMNAFEPITSNVVAYIELGRRDQWKSVGNGEGRELSVIHALLRGVVVHRGIRGIISRFPLLTAVVSAGTFLFISFIVLASCLLPAIEWRFRSHEPPPEPEVFDKPRRRPRRMFSEIGDWDASRRQRAVKRSRSVTTPRHSMHDIKIEEVLMGASAPSAGPSSASSSVPLRRRRSRLSHPSESEA